MKSILITTLFDYITIFTLFCTVLDSLKFTVIFIHPKALDSLHVFIFRKGEYYDNAH